MPNRPTTVIALAAVALAGCLDAPSDDSAACAAHDDCGPCGLCRNGVCDLDPDPPRCVTEEHDPCDGQDNDGNGIVDDPEVCWAPVFAWAGPHGTRCFGPSPLGPPAACAAYTADDDAPAFALAAQPRDGVVPMRQCSLGDTHVLVRDAPLGDALGLPTHAPIQSWEAAGYTCAAPLGYAEARAPDPSITSPYGVTCPLQRAFTTAPAPTASTPRYHYGTGGSPPSGYACDPTATVWVVADAQACAPPHDPACVLPRCPVRPTGHVIAQTHESGLIAGSFDQIHIEWTILNTGPIAWPPTWRFMRAHGSESASGSRPLGVCVGVGETVILPADLGAPELGLDMREDWVIETDDGYRFAPAAFEFDVETTHQAALVGREPALDASHPPDFGFAFAIDLQNIGAAEWGPTLELRRESGAMTTVSSFPLTHHVEPRHTASDPSQAQAFAITLPARTPTTLGTHTETWRLYDGDGVNVPIDGSGPLTLSLRVVGFDEAAVVETSPAPGTRLVPGAPFLQTWVLENRGRSTWRAGWTLRQTALRELAEIASVRLGRDVAPGERWRVAIPMRVPTTAPNTEWREGWTFFREDDVVVPVDATDAAGTPTFTDTGGAWIWTRVISDVPCDPGVPASAASRENDDPDVENPVGGACP